VRLSVKLTTGFADPRRDETWRRHPLFPSHQLCLGAPRSHQRTWVDKDAAKPDQSSDNLSPKQNLGAPYLARFGEMWDSTALSPNIFPAKSAYPSLSIKAEDGEPDL
jgi:hypothetical protein